MQLLVVRHAIAEQREEFARTGKDDSQRPLTHDGRRKMRRGAVGLRAVVPAIDVLATSPLLRAVQTAEILAAVYNGRNMVTVKELSPDSEFPPFLRWLRTQDAGGTVAIVGHEPHLSGLTSWLLTGAQAVVCLPQEWVQRACWSSGSSRKPAQRRSCGHSPRPCFGNSEGRAVDLAGDLLDRSERIGGNCSRCTFL